MSADNEYGKLRKVLLCKPDYYEWQPINETAKKTISEGQSFTREDAQNSIKSFLMPLNRRGWRYCLLSLLKVFIISSIPETSAR